MKLFAMACALLASSALSAPAGAVALDTLSYWSFSGVCAPGDCDGTGEGLLTLKNYSSGDALSVSNFVGLTYSSSVLPAVTVTSVSFLDGNLGNTPGRYDFNLLSSDSFEGIGQFNLFSSQRSGFWCAVCAFDYGNEHSWSIASAPGAVPEPAAWTMMVAGFGALGAALRRRGPRVGVRFA